jgi:thiol-disulfide isomerase/thioredoxin
MALHPAPTLISTLIADMSRLRPLLLMLAIPMLLATGCSNGAGTGDKGFVSGDGDVTVLPVSDRKKPGLVSGETLDGDDLSLASFAGKVVVVNVWGSWCPPCRAEAGDLGAAARELAPLGVQFVGLDTRDSSKHNGLSFERRYDVPYPSIYDPDGRNLLAFRGTLLPNRIPSTVVIDRDGRVAASILGSIPSKTTLVDLVRDVAG